MAIDGCEFVVNSNLARVPGMVVPAAYIRDHMLNGNAVEYDLHNSQHCV